MLALDEARAWMDAHGRKACDALGKRLARLRAQAAALGYADGQPAAPPGCRYDPLRLVLHAPEGGDCLGARLAARGLDVEMTDEAHIVCILPLKGNRRALRRLRKALRHTARMRGAAGKSANRAAADAAIHSMNQADIGNTGGSPTAAIHSTPITQPEAAADSRPAQWPQRRIPLHQAAFAPHALVPPADAVGMVCAACVGRYPPGVAWLTPGDEVTPAVVGLILKTPQAHLFGLSAEGYLPCVSARK